MTRRTAVMMRATQSMKLIPPMAAPRPHGSQTLVRRAATTSRTRMIIACAVPLRWPQPSVTPYATLAAKKSAAKLCEPGA